MSTSGYLLTPGYSSIINDNNGIKINAIEVGMAVFKHLKVGFFSFKMEYLKNVPIASDVKIIESTIPRNRWFIEYF